MTRINGSDDCGNSPKNKLVQQLSFALTLGDIAMLLDSVTDDIYWEIVGERSIHGKDGLTKALGRVELTIEHVLTHGRVGAVNGTAIFSNSNARSFCDVYEFNGAKGTLVKSIASYRIDLQ